MSDSPDAVVGEMNEERVGGCPVAHERAPHPTQGGGNRGWWPDRLNLKILAKNPAVANPLGEDFNYAEAFKTLDLAEEKLKKAARQRVGDSAIQDHFGDLLFKLGRYQEAASAWQRALDGDLVLVDQAAIAKKLRSATDASMRGPRGAAPRRRDRVRAAQRVAADRRGQPLPRLRSGVAGGDQPMP